jgi:hypothetical protein
MTKLLLSLIIWLLSILISKNAYLFCKPAELMSHLHQLSLKIHTSSLLICKISIHFGHKRLHCCAIEHYILSILPGELGTCAEENVY